MRAKTSVVFRRAALMRGDAWIEDHAFENDCHVFNFAMA